MKSNRLAIMFGGVLLLSTVTFLCAAAQTVPRKSADGIEFPPAPPERKFHPKIALGGTILGQRPDDIGRVFNTKKSAALLAKRSTQDLGCDWFVINMDGADVVGLHLTDGRVSKAVLFYEVASATRVANLRKQVEASADHSVKVTVTPIEHEKKQSLMIAFEVEPIEFYVATHTVIPKVADALRQHVWVQEMNDVEATLVGDGPGKYLAIYAPDNAKTDAIGAGTVFAEGGAPTDVQIEFEARNKQEAREQAMKKHKNLKDVVKLPGTVPEKTGK